MKKQLIIGGMFVAFSWNAYADPSPEVCADRIGTIAVVGAIVDECLLDDQDSKAFMDFQMSVREQRETRVCHDNFQKSSDGKLFILQTLLTTREVVTKEIAKVGLKKFCGQYGIEIREKSESKPAERVML